VINLEAGKTLVQINDQDFDNCSHKQNGSPQRKMALEQDMIG